MNSRGSREISLKRLDISTIAMKYTIISYGGLRNEIRFSVESVGGTNVDRHRERSWFGTTGTLQHWSMETHRLRDKRLGF